MRCFEAAHLAVPAAEPVAAHGIVGKRTLLTAVGATPCTLLMGQRGFIGQVCKSQLFQPGFHTHSVQDVQ